MPSNALLVHLPKPTGLHPLLGRCDFGTLLPMGLLSIAGHATARGHRVRVANLGVEPPVRRAAALLAIVDELEIDTVGLSLHWHHQTHELLSQLAALRRARPRLRLVLGGMTASAFWRDLLRDHPVDAVVVGEGEEPFARLLDRPAGESLAGVPNLARRVDGNPVLTSERWAATSAELDSFDLFPHDALLHPERVAALQANPWLRGWGLRGELLRRLTRDPGLFCLSTLRGCPHTCGFCAGSRPSQERLAHRDGVTWRSAETGLESVRRAARAGFRSLLFEHLDSPGPAREHIALLRGLADERPFPKVVVELRTAPAPGFLDALGELGRRGVAVRAHISPHIADPALQRRWCSRPLDEAALGATLDRCQELGIGAVVFYARALPGQPSGLRARLHRIRAHPAVHAVLVHRIELEPGAPMAEDPSRYGLELHRSTLAHYAALHARPRWPEPLGYASGASQPA